LRVGEICGFCLSAMSGSIWQRSFDHLYMSFEYWFGFTESTESDRSFTPGFMLLTSSPTHYQPCTSKTEPLLRTTVTLQFLPRDPLNTANWNREELGQLRGDAASEAEAEEPLLLIIGNPWSCECKSVSCRCSRSELVTPLFYSASP